MNSTKLLLYILMVVFIVYIEVQINSKRVLKEEISKLRNENKKLANEVMTLRFRK